jgi:hypothetical protein
MVRHHALILLAVSLSCFRLSTVCAADLPPSPEQLVMLRNGEILRGRVTRQDDHYLVTIADGELRLRVSDVDSVCQTLEDAYQARRARITVSRADDHLDLADWCVRQGLPSDAARELSCALALEPRNPRITLIDRRLEELLAPPPPPRAAVAKPPSGPRVTDEDLDRMVRALPPPAIESFTISIQPLLVNSCATAGCHGSANKGNYSLIRVPGERYGNRRLTQRNLHETLSWIDFQTPQRSRLLVAAGQPHGPERCAVFDPQGTKYRELLIWIGMLTQKAVFAPDIASEPPSVRPAGMNSAQQGYLRFNDAVANGGPSAKWSGDEIPPTAAADTDSRPVRTPHRYRATKPATSPLPTTPQPISPPLGIPMPATNTVPAGADPYDAAAFNRQFSDKP